MQRAGSDTDVVGFSKAIISFEGFGKEWETVLGKWWDVIPGRLSFTIHPNEAFTVKSIKADPSTFFFSSWMQESYEGFCSDFGPVNLAAVVRFCRFVREKFSDPRLSNRHLVYYCDPNVAYATNTAFLLGAFLVLVEKWTPEQAAAPFRAIQPSPFRMFRDATHVPSTYDLCLLDCLRGLYRAVATGWLDYQTFDVEQYEMLDDPETADVHVMCPKFVAFRGPSRSAEAGARWERSPAEFVGLFKHLGVSAVVRLNEAETYDGSEFASRGIRHHDLYFDDCTAPSAEVVAAFHAKSHREPGAVAVHCTAGLGRTGTLVATWIMREHGFSAREAIAWLRIVRPGSVIGPQQHFLDRYECALRGGSPGKERSARPAPPPCSAEHSRLLASQISRTRRGRVQPEAASETASGGP